MTKDVITTAADTVTEYIGWKGQPLWPGYTVLDVLLDRTEGILLVPASMWLKKTPELLREAQVVLSQAQEAVTTAQEALATTEAVPPSWRAWAEQRTPLQRHLADAQCAIGEALAVADERKDGSWKNIDEAAGRALDIVHDAQGAMRPRHQDLNWRMAIEEAQCAMTMARDALETRAHEGLTEAIDENGATAIQQAQGVSDAVSTAQDILTRAMKRWEDYRKSCAPTDHWAQAIDTLATAEARVLFGLGHAYLATTRALGQTNAHRFWSDAMTAQKALEERSPEAEALNAMRKAIVTLAEGREVHVIALAQAAQAKALAAQTEAQTTARAHARIWTADLQNAGGTDEEWEDWLEYLSDSQDAANEAMALEADAKAWGHVMRVIEP